MSAYDINENSWKCKIIIFNFIVVVGLLDCWNKAIYK